MSSEKRTILIKYQRLEEAILSCDMPDESKQIILSRLADLNVDVKAMEWWEGENQNAESLRESFRDMVPDKACVEKFLLLTKVRN